MSALSSLLGLDSAHNAGVAANTAKQQTTLQNQYGSQAASLYGQLGQQGATQAGQYNSQYLQLLNHFGSLAGLGGNTINTSNPNGTGGGNPNQYANPYLTQLFGGQSQQQQGQGENPYALDANQQQLLNQQVASLGKQAQQAYASTAQQLQARGISDPRYLEVAQQTINEHFAALKADTETKFYEQIKQDKLKALQDIMSGLAQYGQQGISQQEAAGSGFLGLQGGAQASSVQNQSLALQNQNLANDQMSGLFHLITQFLPGGTLGSGGGVIGGDASLNPNPLSGSDIPFDTGQ